MKTSSNEVLQWSEELNDLELFRSLLDQSNVAFFIVNIPEGEVQDCTLAGCTLLGLDRKDVLKRSLSDFFPEEEWLRIRELFEKVGANENEQHSLTIPLMLVDSEQKESPVEVSVTTQNIGPNRNAASIVVRDMTGHQKVKEQLLHSQRMEGIGRLAGGIAHDFNNLLAAIHGYCELMLFKMGAEEPLRDDVEQVLAAAQRAASLTRQLLAFSRQQVLRPKVLDLNSVVRDLERMLQRLIGEDIDFETELAAGVGRVKADPGQLEQVIMNLVVNARDAMPNGGTLRITSQYSNPRQYDEDATVLLPIHEQASIVLSVRDTGIGMDSQTIGRICEPFFTTKSQGKGTGLGLSTVYGILNQSNGGLTVQSQPDSGTTFKVYLPSVEERLEERPSFPVEDNVVGKETILVVEDDTTVRNLLIRMLSSCGYDVLVARKGKEALALLKLNPRNVDLLITDVVMPEMSGPEVVAELRTQTPDVKVLYISGYLDESLSHKGEITPENLLAKPFTLSELTRRVRKALSQ